MRSDQSIQWSNRCAGPLELSANRAMRPLPLPSCFAKIAFMRDALPSFIVALLIGLLVGVDRERRKAQQHTTSAGGIRTFTLIALAGAVTASLSQSFGSPWIYGLGGLAVTAIIIAGYIVDTKNHPENRGLTTEVAGLAVFLLGGMAVVGDRNMAVVLAIITSAILAYKQSLHQLVGKIGEDDLYAILKLLIASFIILPILPNHSVDPWQAINPYKVWWLVILISGISLIGYVATRWLGSGRGTAVTGLLGGLVSSTAVALTFARRSRDEEREYPAGADALACGLMLSWVVMFVRVVVIVAVVYLPLLKPILWPMGMMCLVTAGSAGVFYWIGARNHEPEHNGVPLQNPFSLVSAIKFAVFFTAVLVVVRITQQRAPGSAIYAVAGLAGLTDVDAITLSMSRQAGADGVLFVATNAITIAVLSNTVVKVGIISALGSAPLRWRTLLATVAIVCSGGLSFWIHL